MIRCTFILLLLLSVSFVLYANTVVIKPITSRGNVYSYKIIAIIGSRKSVSDISLVKPDICKGVVLIFPGYRGEADKYKQSPGYIIHHWKIEDIAILYNICFAIPNMKTSTYSMEYYRETSLFWDNNINGIPGGIWATEVIKRAIKRITNSLPYIVIGISTGVEGAIKFALKNNIKRVVALSGNFNLFLIKKGSGEYNLYKYRLGDRDRFYDRWLAESPHYLIKDKDITVYLFCEEYSKYIKQAHYMIDDYDGSARIVNMLKYGRGKRHNWKFWADKRVYNSIKSIILESLHDRK